MWVSRTAERHAFRSHARERAEASGLADTNGTPVAEQPGTVKNRCSPNAVSTHGNTCLSGSGEKTKPPRRAPKRERGLFEKPADSGVWWIRYKDEHRKERREKAGTKALARALYIKRKAEVRERHLFPPPPRDPRTTVNALIDDVLARMKGQMRSYREYERAGDIWKAEFGDKLLREVTPGDIERWRAKQLELSVASINRHLAFLKRAFNLAIADGLAGINPVRAVKFEKENNARVRFLSRDEESRLRGAIGHDQWTAVAVALATGMRQSEQFGLRWEHVDEPNAVLVIPRSKHGERRTIPLSPGARSLFAGLKQRAGDSPWVFPSGKGSTPVNTANWMGRVWRPALVEAKLEDFRWHDLRHTFASRLVMAGVDLRTVQELLGHKTLAMTERYSHLSPSHVRDAVTLLDHFAPTAASS